MNKKPELPVFSFIANSGEKEDMSGIASWIVPLWNRGEWTTETIKVEFKTFREALLINTMIKNVWCAGEATGYSSCENRVLETLKY